MRRALAVLVVTMLMTMPDTAHKGQVADKAKETARLAGCAEPAVEFEPALQGSLLMLVRCREMKPLEQREREAK